MQDYPSILDMSAIGPNDSEVMYRVVENQTNVTPHIVPDGPVGGQPEENTRSLGQTLWIYVGPFIFVTGIVGNILVLVVMSGRRMQGTTTSVYLRVMAIADICVLIAGMIPEWLEAMDIVIFKYIHPATCKFEKFSFYTCADTAIWILVIFTIDRFIAVCFPLSKKEYCLPSKAKYYSLGAFVLGIVKNFHVFWTRGAEFKLDGNSTVLKSNCGRPTPEFLYFERFVRPWIAFSLVSILPFCVILVCNVFIIRALIQVKRLRTEQCITSQSDKTLVQMSTMCLSASFCFLICVAPSIVLLIGKPAWYDLPWYGVAKAVNNQLTYINHSINFFLYCMTGKRFRMQLIRVCRCTRTLSGSPIDSIDSHSRTTVYKVSNSRMSPKMNMRLQLNSPYASPYKPPTKNGHVGSNYTKMEPILRDHPRKESNAYIAQALKEELESSM